MRRYVRSINRVRETVAQKEVMYECNIDVYGLNESVDVLLKESEFNMMRMFGYYIC